MDSNWNYQSAPVAGVAANTVEALNQEVAFGVDLNGDAVLGNTFTDIEVLGNTKLVRDTFNFLYAQVGTSAPISIKFNGQGIYTNIFAGWQTLAVETVNGQNLVLWKNVISNTVSVWQMDSNWNYQSAPVAGVAANTVEALNQEASFGVDLNGDGIVGILPTITIVAIDNSSGEVIAGQPQNLGQFALNRTGNVSAALTVGYTVSGTATNGIDYSTLSGSVTFAAGNSNAVININVIDDSVFEGNETVVLNLVANNSAYSLSTNTSATVTIADNDLPTITVVANDSSAAEAVSGQIQNPGQFTFSRTGNTANALTVNFGLGGTAISGSDYSALATSVTFAVGASTAVVNINVIDDAVVEGSESVFLEIIANSAYALGAARSASITIADNDLPIVPSMVEVSATDNVAAETTSGQIANLGQFTLTRVGTNTAIAVNYTLSGTAANGTDYITLNGVTNFAVGAATAIVSVSPIDDALFEGNETVILTLASGSGYTLGALNTSTITINDNDLPIIAISANDASAGEVAAGQTQNSGQFTLTRTGNTAAALAVGYTVSGTATNGVDYSSLNGSVTFAAGASTAFVNVNVTDDLAVEGSETVVLTLNTNASIYSLGATTTASVTISDNDLPVVPSMVEVSATDNVAAETISGQTANLGQFTLTRTGANTAIAVNYTLSGTAANGTDYITLNGVANFAVGATTAIVTVSPIDDALFEGNETVILTLASGSGYTLGALNTSTITINDNDLPTITVTANDSTAAEVLAGQIQNSGQFTFTRTGSTANPLTVNFGLGGTATSGSDYSALATSVNFAAGASTAVVNINVIDDAIVEGSETVFLQLIANASSMTLIS